jgi:hypothetical protein
MYRLTASITEVIIKQLPIKGTLVICVTIVWLSKLSCCASSLAFAFVSTLAFILCVKELLLIRFD